MVEVPAVVSDMRPTAKLVYLVLVEADQARFSQQDVVSRTGLGERAVRSALRDLVDQGLVVEEPYLVDLREKRYRVRETGE